METDKDISVLALVKGDERYVFLFDDAHRAETVRTMSRFASNPDLSFSWYDAAVLCQKVREGAATPKPRNRLADRGDCWPLDE